MHQRGNILFLILLAVVLFAALSYAVTSSMRGGGKDMGEEKLRTGAAAISQYVTLLRNEVQRLMLVNDCKVENLDWRHNYYKRVNGNVTNEAQTNTPVPPVPKAGCAIFTAQGGAISPQSFEKYADPAYKPDAQPAFWLPGHAGFRWVNRKNELTEANDVSIMIVGLDQNLCRYLLNPQNPPSLPNEPLMNDTDANAPIPAPYTGAATQIDHAANIAGDFWADYEPMTPPYCRLGAIILPL